MSFEEELGSLCRGSEGVAALDIVHCRRAGMSEGRGGCEDKTMRLEEYHCIWQAQRRRVEERKRSSDGVKCALLREILWIRRLPSLEVSQSGEIWSLKDGLVGSRELIEDSGQICLAGEQSSIMTIEELIHH